MELVAPHHDWAKLSAGKTSLQTSTKLRHCKLPAARLPTSVRPLFALALVVAFSVATNTNIIGVVSASLDLTLGFTSELPAASSLTPQMSQHEPIVGQRQPPGYIASFVSHQQQLRREQDLQRLMSDELIVEEFHQTGAALEFVSQTLEQFAVNEQLDPAKAGEGSLVSQWLQALGGGTNQLQVTLSEFGKANAVQLDLLYATFWSKFKPLIEQVVTEKLTNGVQMGDDLAFRCTRYTELAQLRELASISTIYRLLFDIFGSDLYVHCLRRKLAMVKLYRVAPSTVLRQFVDIYLNFPAHFSRLLLQLGDQLDANTDKSIWQTTASLALRFNLGESLAKYGSLEQAASLVFGDSSFALGFSLGGREAHADKLIDKFKHDCQEHTNHLAFIWGKFDEVANFLSSPMNNLADFNERIKLAAPPLVYGSICGQLVMAASH